MPVLSEAGQKVFDARYAARDDNGEIIETFEQAVYRLAKAAASAEKENQSHWEEKFADIIGSLLFIPSTPVWANVGKPDRPWQPAACFVLSVEDSLESMYETLKQTALVFKSGGGVGYNFSSIRPRGSLVRSTKGQASGVVELIKLYDASSNMVMQGGVRRGASMGILNIEHPEIEDFVRAKLDGGLTNFNLSVGVTDAFMEALENGREWPLVFGGRVHKVVQAKELWDMIVGAAHACGDPGLIFLDRLQENNPVPCNPINATNPCVVGSTWVTTSEGPRQVNELVGKQAEVIVNGVPYRTGEEGFFETGIKQVVRLTTREGYSLRLTPDHRVLRVVSHTRYRIESEWVQVNDLKPGDRILLHNHRSLSGWPGELTEGEGYLLGLLIGDGTLKKDAAVLSVWLDDMAMNDSSCRCGASSVMRSALKYAMDLPYCYRADFQGWYRAKRGEYRLKLVGLKTLAERMGLFQGQKYGISRLERVSSDGYRGFLRGLFDCDGSVQGSQKKGVSIRLAQSNLELLTVVQRMLLRLGIVSTIYHDRRPAGIKLMPDGKGSKRWYETRAQHELVISGDNLAVFAEKVGFGDCEKMQKLNILLSAYRRKVNKERFMAKVLSIKEDTVETVYDVRVPSINAFDANGIYSHNCGEQPLSPGESCLLGSVNLAKMIAEDGSLNRGLLEKTVKLAVRFLDNLVDIAEYPLPSIAEATRATRKIGLGFTGLADALIKAGLPYDSEEGRKFAAEITKLMQEAAHAASRGLAGEKGCFPLWEQSVFYPAEKRRNAACITVAPTGSVTTLAGCEGYGVEPIFAIAYRKSTNVAGDFEVFSPLFLEACRKSGVPAEVLSEVARRGSCQHVRGVPEEIALVFKGAQDISPEDHILMQAEVQKYVDNAVSKTINLPEHASVEDIDKCYRMACSLNLKGITVFRDGCKQGTVTVGQKEDDGGKPSLRRGEILPRPVSAHGVTHRLDSGCGKIYLTVNYQPDSGEILETFITTGSDGGCLIYTEATSRLISLAIRGGIDVEQIIEQLMSTHSCPSYMAARSRGRKLSPGKSCASAIALKLAEVQRDLNGGTSRPESGTGSAAASCPECGQVLARAEGCLVCRDCGYSKC